MSTSSPVVPSDVPDTLMLVRYRYDHGPPDPTRLSTMYLPGGEVTVRWDCVTAAIALADQIKPASIERQVRKTFTRIRPPHFSLPEARTILSERQVQLLMSEQALPRRLVLAPAEDPRAMPDAPIAGVIEGHLDKSSDEVRSTESLLTLPPARIAMAAGSRLVWLQAVDERALLGRAQSRRVPDHVKLSRIVVQTQDQQPDRAVLLARPVARDHRIDRSDALTLTIPLRCPGR